MLLRRQGSRRKKKCHYTQVTSLIQDKEVLYWVWALFPKSWESLVSIASSTYIFFKKKKKKQSPLVAAVSLCKLLNKKSTILIFRFILPSSLQSSTFGTRLWRSLKMSLAELALLNKLMDKLHCKFILLLGLLLLISYLTNTSSQTLAPALLQRKTIIITHSLYTEV